MIRTYFQEIWGIYIFAEIFTPIFFMFDSEFLNLSPVYTTLNFWYRTTFWFLDYLFQKSGTGTNFIRAVPKIERSVNGA